MTAPEHRPESAPTGNLGPRLRALRLRQGLSQRELARRAGVTNATVSHIEQDRVSPSVASLRKITRALGVSLATFFADDRAAAWGPFYAGDALPEVGTEGVSMRLVGAHQLGRAIQMLRERYPPGTDAHLDPRGHMGEACGIVLRGQIEVTVGALTQVLGAGDAYYCPGRTPRRFRNVGDEPCELVSAATRATHWTSSHVGPAPTTPEPSV